MNPLRSRLKTAVAAVTRVRLSRSAGPLAAVVAVLGGFGAVAVAVVPQIAADDAPVVQRQVIEDLAGVGVSSQIEALAGQDIELRRSTLTRESDSVPAVLRRLDAQDLQAALALARDESLREAVGGGAGRYVQLRSTRAGRLVDVVVRYPVDDAALARTHYARLTLSRAPQGWSARVETLPLASEIRRAAGTVRSNFKAAAQEAGLPLVVGAQLSELFGSEVEPLREAQELREPREIRKGESFSVVYEALLAEGEPVAWASGGGRVLAAERSGGAAAGATQRVLWFQEPDSAGAYYDAKGHPLPQSFMAAPLAFDRVTSGFEVRMDPILRRQMAHNGIDYSAPLGTPVFSVAPGVVEFAGRQSGYGNVVEVRHSSERTTLYAHLSRIDVAAGDSVARGRVIGAVGRTGWATGPHLHFEYRIGGVHQDPQLATRTLQQAALTPAARRLFDQAARQAGLELAAARAASPRRAGFASFE